MTTLRLVSTSPSDTPGTDADSALGVLLGDPSWLTSLAPSAELGVLRELACALVELARGARDSALVLTPAKPTLRGAPWQVGLERDGESVLVSVFRHGAVPDVAQAERRILLRDARAALLEAIDGNQTDRGLALARDELAAVRIRRVAARSSRRVSADSGPGCMRIRASASARLRTSSPSEVARADLQALFHRGKLTVRNANARCRLDDVLIVLLAEQLVQLTARALDAHADMRPMLRRTTVAGVCLGVRLDPLGVALLLRDHKFPSIACIDLAAAVARFGRRLCDAIYEADPAQRFNLRLTALLENIDELDARIADCEAPEDHALLVAAPESYRAFAESDTARPPPVAPAMGKLRFVESWRAEVPGIDLRSTLLLGDRLIVASSHELACIDRSSGRLRWTRRTRRAASIPTPLGLARLFADGRLHVLDADDGQTMFELTLAPCVGASASGAVVNAAGLPHLLLLGEGADHLTAIDLDACEIRWRRTIERPGRLRLRRAGKLVLVAAGDAPLVALDLLTGELVWRRSTRQRFDHPLALDGGQLFALSSPAGRRVTGRLEHIDAWSGEMRWSVSLPRSQPLYGAPLLCGERVLCLSRDDQRLGVIAFDRKTGELVYDQPACLSRAPAACLVVDGSLIANSSSGELTALDTADASVRYRHSLAAWRRVGGHDGPRSLRPVLRSGALFVPQSDVSVVRPHDGVVLGRVGGDLIPDSLLVDERCGVYVAEASGYLTAYHAQPMLTLIQTL